MSAVNLVAFNINSHYQLMRMLLWKLLDLPFSGNFSTFFCTLELLLWYLKQEVMFWLSTVVLTNCTATQCLTTTTLHVLSHEFIGQELGQDLTG